MAGLREQPRRVEHPAVVVELMLVGGTVADPDRADSRRSRASRRASVRHADACRAASAARGGAGRSRRLACRSQARNMRASSCLADAEERADADARVARPREAVVPVADAAELLGQRRGRRRDRRARRRVGEQPQRDAGFARPRRGTGCRRRSSSVQRLPTLARRLRARSTRSPVATWINGSRYATASTRVSGRPGATVTETGTSRLDARASGSRRARPRATPQRADEPAPPLLRRVGARRASPKRGSNSMVTSTGAASTRRAGARAMSSGRSRPRELGDHALGEGQARTVDVPRSSRGSRCRVGSGGSSRRAGPVGPDAEACPPLGPPTRRPNSGSPSKCGTHIQSIEPSDDDERGGARVADQPVVGDRGGVGRACQCAVSSRPSAIPNARCDDDRDRRRLGAVVQSEQPGRLEHRGRRRARPFDAMRGCTPGSSGTRIVSATADVQQAEQRAEPPRRGVEQTRTPRRSRARTLPRSRGAGRTRRRGPGRGRR